MRKTTSLAVSALALLCFYTSAQAQDGSSDNHTIGITVPQVALVDLESATTKNIALDFAELKEAGNGLESPNSNSDLWLNYSSILSGQEGAATKRKITVKINAPIPGLDVKVQAAASSGSGNGTLGNAVSNPITLNTSDQDLITGIGSCYTGNGISNGHNLTYSMLANYASYGQLVSKTNTITVTYTIADN